MAMIMTSLPSHKGDSRKWLGRDFSAHGKYRGAARPGRKQATATKLF